MMEDANDMELEMEGEEQGEVASGEQRDGPSGKGPAAAAPTKASVKDKKGAYTWLTARETSSRSAGQTEETSGAPLQ